jgi:folate-dependent phosphoribosylglycinamide formyltransferase PurN
LNRFGLARWVASFTDLAAIVEIHEPPGRLWRRAQREFRRVGPWRFVDILAFRVYYRLALASKDRAWERGLLKKLEMEYPQLPASTRTLQTASPNDAETERLLREVDADIVIARCKNILSSRIFERPRRGALVMHPGICPEYRNAHGCFWALAGRDLENVGMTLLKVDEGVDTGPVYGFYRCQYNEVLETHTIIQHRVVFDNLDALRLKIEEIVAGTAEPIDPQGRASRAWGQPWLSRYLRWKRLARKK